jgi:hypothetical protein
MRAAIIAVIATVLSWPALAQDGPATVITNQFDAFRADDLDRAFSYASPMIQGYFQTPETFGRMVSQGYPQIRTPGQVTLLGRREEGGRLLQRVEVRGADGVPQLFDYDLVETESGWKINGVTYVKGPPPAV